MKVGDLVVSSGRSPSDGILPVSIVVRVLKALSSGDHRCIIIDDCGRIRDMIVAEEVSSRYTMYALLHRRPE